MANNYHFSWYDPPTPFSPVSPREKYLGSLCFFLLSKFSIFGFFCLVQIFVLGNFSSDNFRFYGILGFTRWFLIFDFLDFLEIAQWNSFLWHIYNFRKALSSNVICSKYILKSKYFLKLKSLNNCFDFVQWSYVNGFLRFLLHTI